MRASGGASASPASVTGCTRSCAAEMCQMTAAAKSTPPAIAPAPTKKTSTKQHKAE